MDNTRTGVHVALRLPGWDTLAEHDRGLLVGFIRTVEIEGREYVCENFPPAFAAGSPLHNVDPALALETYWDDYEALPLTEFWRLYELTTGR
ncbi:hypothetical protein [Amycolatopsis minnesotensis]|uniref:Uncharacterized protein n=1 Tax=Amycolatopsis minnesotensis TaxID=337894 RepID=A0ABN2SAW2_9PSEU